MEAARGEEIEGANKMYDSTANIRGLLWSKKDTAETSYYKPQPYREAAA